MLLHCCDRTINIPESYDSLDEAQEAMQFALFESMGGVDESVCDDYDKSDYGWNTGRAYFNERNGNHNWLIVKQSNSGRFQDV